MTGRRIGLFTLVIVLIQTSWALAQNNIQLFQEILHPLMVQNCAQCHSESATRPKGPTHSHTDPSKAFGVFDKYLPVPSEFEKSKFWTKIQNQHYCTVYSSKCDEVTQIIQNMKDALTKYAVRASAQVNNPSSVQGKRSNESEVQRGGGATELSVSLTATPLNGEQAIIKLKFEEIDSAFAHLTETSIELIPGTYVIEGLNFLVNGQKLSKATGYEKLQRIIHVGEGQKKTSNLTLFNTYFQVKAGDKLSIEFRQFSKTEKSSTRLCKNIQLAREIVLDFSFSIADSNFEILRSKHIKPLMADRSDEDWFQACYELESFIDFNRPALSLTGILNFESGSHFTELYYKWITSIMNYVDSGIYKFEQPGGMYIY